MGQRTWSRAPRPLEVRLFDRVIEVEECWEWTGGKSASGYGQLKVDGRTHYTHRLSWEFFRGPIPDGLVIDHLCRNHACLNPDHLDVVTTAENTRRGLSPGTVTHRTGVCKRGHDLERDGFVVQKMRGKEVRTCRTCMRRRERDVYVPRQRERRREKSREREAAVLADLPLGADPDDPAQRYLTTEEAAEAAHVRPGVIRDWDRRGLITPIAHGKSNYYLEIDVLTAEAQTRRNSRRMQLALEAMEGLNSHVA